MHNYLLFCNRIIYIYYDSKIMRHLILCRSHIDHIQIHLLAESVKIRKNAYKS